MNEYHEEKLIIIFVELESVNNIIACSFVFCDSLRRLCSSHEPNQQDLI